MNLLQKNKKVLLMFSVFTASFLFGYLGYAFVRVRSETPMIYSTPYNANLQDFYAQKAPLFVASINSDKYHFVSCSGAKRIKEENKIYFFSTEEAERRGYTPTKNCKELGLFTKILE